MKAEAKTGKTLMMVDLDKVSPNPLNQYKADDLEDLIGNIKSLGLLTPLSVVGPTTHGEYILISGERRYWACKQIHSEDETQFAQIPIYVLHDAGLYQDIQELMIESANLEIRDNFDKNKHRLHILQILKRMVENEQLAASKVTSEACRYMKVSQRFARMYRNIFENDNEALIDLISAPVTYVDENGDTKQQVVAVSQAATIANMDPETQNEIIEDIKSGTNPGEAIAKKKKQPQNEPVSTGTSFAENDYHFEGYKDEEDDAELDQNDAEYLQWVAEQDGASLDEQFQAHKSGVSVNLYHDNDTKTDTTLDCVEQWAKNMLKKEEFTEQEETVIELLRQVVEHYDQL